MITALRRLAIMSLTVGGLTACSDTGFQMPAMPSMPDISATSLPQLPSFNLFSFNNGPASSQLQMTSGPIAAGPDGYCVDARASDAATGFAIFGPCAALGAQDASPVMSGVYTVQFGAPQSAVITSNGAAFVDVLKSGQANALLAENAASVVIHHTALTDNVVTVRLEHGAPSPIANTQALEWRAFLDIDGRLVTVALHGLSSSPLSADAGSFLLQQGIAAMIAANPEKISAGS